MKFYLNAEIKNLNQPSLLSSAAETCLQPYRYLFNGKSYQIVDKQIVQEELSFPEKNYLKTTSAVLAFIPGFIAGTLLRLVETLMGINAESRALIDQFSQREIKLHQAPENTPLNEFGKIIGENYEKVFVKISKTPDIWKDAQFIADFSELMEQNYRYMDLYFKTLAAECKNDPVAMTERMIVQPQNRTGKEKSKLDYSYTFFGFSTRYHLARGCACQVVPKYSIDPDEPLPLDYAESLTPEQQEPYFNPTKPQYRWRELYNTFCDKVDAYGLRVHLEAGRGDQRFSSWSRHDTKKVKAYYEPDSLPT